MAREKTFIDDLKEFLEILNKNNVQYLVVGAYATMFYTGVVRSSKDFDIWIRPTDENALSVAVALGEFLGVRVNKDDLLDRKSIYCFGKEPYRVDIFNYQGDILFDKAWRKKIAGHFLNVGVNYISKEDLIALKKKYGRGQDVEDVKLLQKIKKHDT